MYIYIAKISGKQTKSFTVLILDKGPREAKHVAYNVIKTFNRIYYFYVALGF